MSELDSKVLSSFKEVDEDKITQQLDEALRKLKKKIIVLDDDPTGVQTVHDISVYTDWSRKSIEDGFAEKNSMFFILTNSRAFTAEESKKLHEGIADNIQEVSKETGKDYILISRGDSTLRGHYPLETAVLRESIESNSENRFDGEIICPFFKEGSRFTIGNVHYVRYEDRLVPAGETEFAKDKTFGYKASHLGKWIEEKSQGEFREEDVTYVSLEDLRNVNIDKIKDDLMNIRDFNKVVVNAVDYIDIKIFALAFVAAVLDGKRFMVRSAASITKVLGNVADKKLLTRKELVNDNKNGGIIVVGSHVKKTSDQLEALRACQNIKFIEFNQHLVLDPVELKKEVEHVVAACEKYIKAGKTVVVYTRRERFDLNTEDKEEELKISVKISDAVTSIVQKLKVRPNFIVAKGGITSSEIGTKALGVKKATVMGQIKAGIPVWQTDAESKFSIMPYVIFPGNVGTISTLKEVVEILMGR
ncbi:MAG: hydroxyacid dehydrogenase [Firmicutes bacterium]|nr:hydroxyacid dehydrogenase [Bacillota bacterium]